MPKFLNTWLDERDLGRRNVLPITIQDTSRTPKERFEALWRLASMGAAVRELIHRFATDPELGYPPWFRVQARRADDWIWKQSNLVSLGFPRTPVPRFSDDVVFPDSNEASHREASR